MLSLPFVPAGRQPLYLQLYQYIRSEAEAGHLVSGEKLPSKRQLAKQLKLSVVTVEGAYSQLVAEGYLESRDRSGYYVLPVAVRPELAALLEGAQIYEKPTFGSTKLAEDLKALSEEEEIELELIGLCTDICVVSNALLLKAYMPEVKISVDASCCAGVTPEKHLAALETMRSCQIQVTGA